MADLIIDWANNSYADGVVTRSRWTEKVHVDDDWDLGSSKACELLPDGTAPDECTACQ